MKKLALSFTTAITGVGALCALCCVVPIAGLLGLGSLEAFFCDSPWAIGMGFGLMTIGFAILASKYWKGPCSSFMKTCSMACGCKKSA